MGCLEIVHRLCLIIRIQMHFLCSLIDWVQPLQTDFCFNSELIILSQNSFFVLIKYNFGCWPEMCFLQTVTQTKLWEYKHPRKLNLKRPLKIALLKRWQRLKMKQRLIHTFVSVYSFLNNKPCPSSCNINN